MHETLIMTNQNRPIEVYILALKENILEEPL